MQISIKEQTKTRRYTPDEVKGEKEDKNKNNDVIYSRGGKRPKPFSTTYRPKINGGINQKREFSTINNPSISLITDNTKSHNFINRENTLYKVYYMYYDSQFNKNITSILENMYDNNEFVVFNMYFLISPENRDFIIDADKLLSHMNKFDTDVLNNQIVKVFKNTGMVLAQSIVVGLSLYDENNLKSISKSIRINMINNIKEINQFVHEDFHNTVLNFDKPINLEKDDVIIVIGANFDILKEQYQE